MGLFSKRDKSVSTADEGDGTSAQTPRGEPGVDRDYDRAVDGPYDLSEASDVGTRVDLGAVQIPVFKGMTFRFEVEEGSGRVLGVVCGLGDSNVQVQAFAAPRSSGIWEGIRADLQEAITSGGGQAREADGLLGVELYARMPIRGESGGVQYRPVRFVGVDGPKWFLRAVVNGPAASEDTQFAAIVTFVRGIVVNRGDDPRPPREVLTLTPPQRRSTGGSETSPGAAEQGDADSSATDPDGSDISDPA